MNLRHYDKSGLTDELELGERASDWLLIDTLGALYTYPWDRAQSVVTGCFRKMLTLGEVPPEWTPGLDEHGNWILRDRMRADHGRME